MTEPTASYPLVTAQLLVSGEVVGGEAHEHLYQVAHAQPILESPIVAVARRVGADQFATVEEPPLTESQRLTVHRTNKRLSNFFFFLIILDLLCDFLPRALMDPSTCEPFDELRSNCSAFAEDRELFNVTNIQDQLRRAIDETAYSYVLNLVLVPLSISFVSSLITFPGRITLGNCSANVRDSCQLLDNFVRVNREALIPSASLFLVYFFSLMEWVFMFFEYIKSQGVVNDKVSGEGSNFNFWCGELANPLACGGGYATIAGWMRVGSMLTFACSTFRQSPRDGDQGGEGQPQAIELGPLSSAAEM